MSHKSRGLKVLSLALIAIAGLMAFMAASASALWLENGSAIGANKTVAVATHVEGNLFVEKETNLEILCGTINSSGLELLTGTSEAKGSVTFSACKTWQGGKDITVNCKPVEPITASGKAKLILHNAKNYVLFEPAVAGGNFAVIKFKETCALPESNNVKGSLVAECLKASNLEKVDCSQAEATHLLQPNNEGLFSTDVLTYGTKAAILKGVAAVKLTSGNSWAGHV